MGDALAELPLLLLVVILVVVPILLAVAMAVAARRWVKVRVETGYYDVLQAIYSGLVVMYALIAAFLLVVVWQQFAAADSSTAEEAASLVSIYRASEAFPPAPQQALRGLLRTYATTVVNDEWMGLKDGKSSPKAAKALDALYRFYGRNHATVTWQVPYSDSFGRLSDLNTFRSQRLLAARSALPDALWWLLIFGAVLVVCFSFLFYLTSLAMQVIVTGAVAAFTSSVLLLILLLTHPFTGHISIAPDAFQQALSTFRLIDAGH